MHSQFDTEAYESSLKVLVKEPYRRSNKRGELGAIVLEAVRNANVCSCDIC